MFLKICSKNKNRTLLGCSISVSIKKHSLAFWHPCTSLADLKITVPWEMQGYFCDISHSSPEMGCFSQESYISLAKLSLVLAFLQYYVCYWPAYRSRKKYTRTTHIFILIGIIEIFCALARLRCQSKTKHMSKPFKFILSDRGYESRSSNI